MDAIKTVIEQAFEKNAEITPRTAPTHLKDAVYEAIERLDSGRARVAEKKDGTWVVNDWLNKAVLLYFRIEDSNFIKGGYTNYFDKVPSKFADYNSQNFRRGGFRVVPLAAVRKGAYIAPGVVLMPSYVNIGAYVDVHHSTRLPKVVFQQPASRASRWARTPLAVTPVCACVSVTTPLYCGSFNA